MELSPYLVGGLTGVGLGCLVGWFVGRLIACRAGRSWEEFGLASQSALAADNRQPDAKAFPRIEPTEVHPSRGVWEPGNSEPSPPDPASGPASQTRAGTIDEVRLSRRVVFHLLDQPRHAEGESVSPSITQAGMVEELGSTQSAIGKALRKLVIAGMIEVRLSHVSGRDRRLKAYSLSPQGYRLARELRPGMARNREATSPQSAEEPRRR
jgi:DNA-binding MarR family transcriptional regulator